MRWLLAASLLSLSGCATVAARPMNYTDVQAMQVSNPVMARQVEGRGVRFTALFGAVMPGFGIQGMSQYEDTHAMAAFGSSDGGVTLPYVLIPLADPVLPTLRRGDSVEIEGVPEVDASGVYARVVVFGMRRLEAAAGDRRVATREAAAVDAPTGPVGSVALSPPATSSPRLALIVEGVMTSAELQLAIRDALSGQAVTLIPQAEVGGARAFVGADLLTPSRAEALRDRLGADRVIVVQTSTVASPEVAPPAPPRPSGHHRHHRRQSPPPPPSPAAPALLAMQVYAADRTGTATPASATGDSAQITSEVIRAIRALPAAMQPAPTRSTVSAVSVGASSAPVADDTPPGLPSPSPGVAGQAPAARMWIDLGFHLRDSSRGPTGGKGYWLSPELGFSFPVARAWGMEIVLPLTFGEQKTTSIDGLGNFYSNTGPIGSIGNLAVSFARWMSLGGGRLDVGGIMTLPLSSIFDDNGLQLSGAAGLRGLWDLWRWSTNDLSIIARGRYQVPVGRFDLGGSCAMGLMVPTSSSGGDTEFVAQFGASAFVRLGERAGVGLDLRGVWLPDLDGTFQVSLVPRIRFAPGRANFDIWFNINLNEPYGPSFDDYRVWGLGVTLDVPL